MSEQLLTTIGQLLAQCSTEERSKLFNALRSEFPIHQLEQTLGAPAEVILEAIHRAPELTRRMLRGVIADAAFAQFVVPELVDSGWKDVTPEGNHSFDYKLEDAEGAITIQVKLQRSEKGRPVIKNGTRFGFGPEVFMVEPQKTRGGTEKKNNRKTRPYRYKDFDILAVSLQPSNGHWDSFMYTVSRWLIRGKKADEIATMQPVSMTPNEFWTDDFYIAAQWFRGVSGKKRIQVISVPTSRNRKAFLR